MKTLILNRADLDSLASMELAVSAVERAFAFFARGEAVMPAKVYLPIEDQDGDFRAMPSRLGGVAGLKWVNVHRQNPKQHGLPTVMGVFVLNDAASAFPVAIMDGTLLTALRTGAAGGVASKYLATSSPSTIGFIGCGAQAYTLHEAHRVVYGDFDTLATDRHVDTATRFADSVGGRVVSLAEAARADVVCTATPSERPLIERAWLREGAHINAMGADAPGKRELPSDLLQNAAVYIDDPHQAVASGEINVPISNDEYSLEQIAGTLGEVVAGTLPRPSPSTTTVFDSTGLAIQDLALAEAVCQEAKRRGIGDEIDLVGLDLDRSRA